jgi:hypothetical protein
MSGLPAAGPGTSRSPHGLRDEPTPAARAAIPVLRDVCRAWEARLDAYDTFLDAFVEYSPVPRQLVADDSRIRGAQSRSAGVHARLLVVRLRAQLSGGGGARFRRAAAPSGCAAVSWPRARVSSCRGRCRAGPEPGALGDPPFGLDGRPARHSDEVENAAVGKHADRLPPAGLQKKLAEPEAIGAEQPLTHKRLPMGPVETVAPQQFEPGVVDPPFSAGAEEEAIWSEPHELLAVARPSTGSLAYRSSPSDCSSRIATPSSRPRATSSAARRDPGQTDSCLASPPPKPYPSIRPRRSIAITRAVPNRPAANRATRPLPSGRG